MGRHLIAGPRRRDDRRPAAQPLPVALHGPRPLRPRLRHLGGLPFAHRAYLPREGHGTLRCPDRFDRLRGPGRRVDQSRRRASASSTGNTKQHAGVLRPKAVVLAASTLESTRLLLDVEVAALPERSRELVRRARPLLLRAHHGPERGSATLTTLAGARGGQRRRTARAGMYIARFRNLRERHPDFIRGYGFQGGAGCSEYPGVAHSVPGFGVSFKRAVLRIVSDAARDYRLR